MRRQARNVSQSTVPPAWLFMWWYRALYRRFRWRLRYSQMPRWWEANSVATSLRGFQSLSFLLGKWWLVYLSNGWAFRDKKFFWIWQCNPFISIRQVTLAYEIFAFRRLPQANTPHTCEKKIPNTHFVVKFWRLSRQNIIQFDKEHDICPRGNRFQRSNLTKKRNLSKGITDCSF